MKTYKTRDVAAIAGVTKQTIYNWLRQGIIPEPNRGRGNRFIFTEEDVTRITDLKGRLKKVRRIGVANQKGGVGKTATSINLAACLAEMGRTVLLIDMDPQAHATLGLGVNPDDLVISMYDVMTNDGFAIRRAIIGTPVDGLHLAPADISLSLGEMKLTQTMMGETVLKTKLEAVMSDYNYFIIDTPPSLGLLTINSLLSSEEAIVPIQTQFYSMKGFAQLMDFFTTLRTRTGHTIKYRILPTMFDARTTSSNTVLEQLHTHFPDSMYSTVIRTDTKISEAPAAGIPIIKYANSRGSKDYKAFAAEVIRDEE